MSLFSEDLIEKEIPVYNDMSAGQAEWTSKITFMGVMDKGYLPQNCVYLNLDGNVILEPSTGKMWYIKDEPI